ncbi:hypothetical protein RJZ56_001815 [Blastomyces dermatitidis]
MESMALPLQQQWQWCFVFPTLERPDVGIGGGVPSQHDIRLGDIVVISPRDGMGGWWVPTGVLNQPPTVLQAVNRLKAHFENEGLELMKVVNSVLEKKPRLQKKYKRPEPSSDRLYKPGFIHPLNIKPSCAVVCGDHPSKLTVRAQRTEDESHKNEEWQRYAAMVAAAYARDLLYRLRPGNVEVEKPIRDILSSG